MDRNTVVHSAWPNPTLEAAYAWRPVTIGKKTSSGETTKRLNKDETWSPDLILRLVQLVSELDQFGDRVRSAINLQ